MHTVEILNHLVENNQTLAYFIIFLGLIFEGEIVVITTGVLSYLGALNFWVSLMFILAGGIVKAFAGYYLGGYLYKRYREHNFFKYLEKRVSFFMPRFAEKPFWSIFISKFVMGINYLVVIFSGYKKVNMKVFAKAEVLSTIIWAPTLLSLGFFFSQTALAYSKELSRFSLIVVILLAIFLLFDKLMASVYKLFLSFKNALIDLNNDDKY